MYIDTPLFYSHANECHPHISSLDNHVYWYSVYLQPCQRVSSTHVFMRQSCILILRLSIAMSTSVVNACLHETTMYIDTPFIYSHANECLQHMSSWDNHVYWYSVYLQLCQRVSWTHVVVETTMYIDTPFFYSHANECRQHMLSWDHHVYWYYVCRQQCQRILILRLSAAMSYPCSLWCFSISILNG